MREMSASLPKVGGGFSDHADQLRPRLPGQGGEPVAVPRLRPADAGLPARRDRAAARRPADVRSRAARVRRQRRGQPAARRPAAARGAGRQSYTIITPGVISGTLEPIPDRKGPAVPMTRQTTTCRLALALILASAACATACRQPAVAASGAEQRRPACGHQSLRRRNDGRRPRARRHAARANRGARRPARDTSVAGIDGRAHALAGPQPGLRGGSRCAAWARVELEGPAGECQTLLHPFGGTDFLPAFLMFPACEGYVLVGSEPVGQMPTFTEGDRVTRWPPWPKTIRRSFPEVFAQIGPTPACHSPRPARPGALRLLLVQLARLDARIVHASRFDLASNGRPLEAIPIRGGNARPAALSLTFEVPGGRPQSLVYLPADLDDAAMRRRPGCGRSSSCRRRSRRCSRLPEGWAATRRTILRALVLDQSCAILQDRPVIPGRLLVQRRWTDLDALRPAGWGLRARRLPDARRAARARRGRSAVAAARRYLGTPSSERR